MKLTSISGLLLVTAASAWAIATEGDSVSQAPSYTVDRVTDSVVYFKASEAKQAAKQLTLPYFELELLGELMAPMGDVPYLLLKGQDCKDCTDQKFLYLVRADGKGDPARLVYPGKVRHRRSQKLVYESRVFFGKCLANRNDVYLAFQNDEYKRRRYLQPSVFVAEATPDKLREELITKGRPNLNGVLRQVRKGECREIPPVIRKTLAFDLPAKFEELETEDEKAQESEGS